MLLYFKCQYFVREKINQLSIKREGNCMTNQMAVFPKQFSNNLMIILTHVKEFKPFINTRVKFIYRSAAHMLNLNWSFPSFLFRFSLVCSVIENHLSKNKKGKQNAKVDCFFCTISLSSLPPQHTIQWQENLRAFFSGQRKAKKNTTEKLNKNLWCTFLGGRGKYSWKMWHAWGWCSG